jgi:hypothetical protein
MNRPYRGICADNEKNQKESDIFRKERLYKMISVQEITEKLDRLPYNKLIIIYEFVEFIEQKIMQSDEKSEMSDAEILFAAEQTGSFDFLHEPSENIYTSEDGEPL